MSRKIYLFVPSFLVVMFPSPTSATLEKHGEKKELIFLQSSIFQWKNIQWHTISGAKDTVEIQHL